MKKLSTWKATWQLIRVHPSSFATMWVLYVVGFLCLIAPGLVLQAIFDHLTDAGPLDHGVWSLLALMAGVGMARALLDYFRTFSEEGFRCRGWERIRGNIVSDVLRRPGADLLPVSPGDAINRLRGDVMELADWPSWLPYVFAQGCLAATAVVIMWSINPLLTAVAVIPLLIVVAIVSKGRDRLLAYDHMHRDASSEIVGFLGEVLDSVTAVKAAVAEENVVLRLRSLNDSRRDAGVRFSVFWAVLMWAHSSIADLAVGLVLLLAGSALRNGRFTVGDFALFVAYLRLIVDFPANVGGFLADYQTQAVSIERLLDLHTSAPPAELLTSLPDSGTSTHGSSSAAPFSNSLAVLSATGLTYTYPRTNGARRGISDVSLDIARGEFVVITGRIGSGKTTLLRVLLGLLPAEAGEVRWNGVRVNSPSDFFRPPRAAYTPQTPRLFSETLRENLLMGLADNQQLLEQAIHRAVLEPDLESMSDGLDTQVGPRGVRLSGGQVQRAAVARMYARRADLYVLDDVSSALDVDTERLLWERLLQQRGITCLAVSHRRAALRRADRILVLKDGLVAAVGQLDDLLETCPEVQEIWRIGDAVR